MTSDKIVGWLGKHGEGFAVRLRTLAAFSMTLGILAATIGFAGPASAAPAVWVMPDVRGDVLKRAMNTVQEVTPAKLDIRLIDRRNGQDVHNQTNWSVCSQSPGPGRAINQKTKRVYLYVKRFKQKSCWS
ncbi:MAG: hypothetical protein ACPGVG_12910 [Mycobacterium sp.]